jgi:hypothetical protein
LTFSARDLSCSTRARLFASCSGVRSRECEGTYLRAR